MREIIEALLHVQNKGINHKDLRPENILIHNKCVDLVEFAD